MKPCADSTPLARGCVERAASVPRPVDRTEGYDDLRGMATRRRVSVGQREQQDPLDVLRWEVDALGVEPDELADG